MSVAKTRYTRGVLTALNSTGLDRVYQQLDDELGMILTFHHVRPDPVPAFSPNAHLTIHPAFLERVIKFLRRREIEIISLDEALKRILNPNLSLNRFAVFTFDDGYCDTLQHAAPILHKYDVPYTVYLAPGLIGGTADLWWDGIEALVRQQDRILLQCEASREGPLELDCTSVDKKYKSFKYLLQHFITSVPELSQRQKVRELCWLYKIDMDELQAGEIMSWTDLHQIAQDPLCTIGAHTHNHQALARLSENQARDEVINGASVLEAELGYTPKHFAYPYGYKSAASGRDFELLNELKFETAVTTRGGMIFPGHRDHLTALPRISVNGLFQKMRYFAPLTTGLPTRLSTRLKRLDVV